MLRCAPLGYIILPRFYILSGSVAIGFRVREPAVASVPAASESITYTCDMQRPRLRVAGAPAREFVIFVHPNDIEPDYQR